jgi:hypothetical protein
MGQQRERTGSSWVVKGSATKTLATGEDRHNAELRLDKRSSERISTGKPASPYFWDKLQGKCLGAMTRVAAREMNRDIAG